MSIPRNLGNFADNVNANGKVEVTGINATGTPSGSTALLGNGTWGTVTTAPAGSTGQVQYNNAGEFGAIASGTSGQVLTSAGSGFAPTWASPAGGGSWVYLSTVTASGASTVDVENTFNSTYDMYALIFSGFYYDSGGATTIRLRLKINGSYQTSADYGFAGYSAESSASNRFGNSGTATSIATGYGYNYAGNLSNYASGIIYIQKPELTNTYKNLWGDIGGQSATSFVRDIFTGGYMSNSSSTLTGVRFIPANGSSTMTGTFRLYGIKNN